MMLSLIVARARNGVIGRDNDLPWRLPADLAHFKRITMGKPIIMGRRTWESIDRPLPGRRNCVVTRNPTFAADGIEVFASLDAALAANADAPEVMLIGGAMLYEQALPVADRVYLTEVHADVDGDTRFDLPDTGAWREIDRETLPADANNEHACSFVTLERMP